MTITYIDKVSEQVPATDTVLYACPSSGVSSAHIIYAQCTCEDAVGDSITVNIVQSGGSVAATNQYLQSKSIAAGASEILSELVGRVLKPGDFISVIAANADRLNLSVGIKEIS